MSALLFSVIGFLVMTGILVTLHEYGHFWVARRLGTKVLRFSIGFGKPLYTWYGKDGTEYVIAAIPLGGYVKMLDEREGIVPEHEKAQAFNRQNVYKRMAIVIAGPLVNLIVAVFFYWLVFMIGMKVTLPIVGEVLPGSLADQAGMKPGLQIVAIDERPTPSWQSVVISLVDNVGEESPMLVHTRDPETDAKQTFALPIETWPEHLGSDNLLDAIGLSLARPEVPAQIGSIVAGSPADEAGLQIGDLITHLNNDPVNWSQLVSTLQAMPDTSVQLQVERGKESFTLHITPEAKTQGSKTVGWLGVGIDDSALSGRWVKRLHFDPLTAFVKAIDKTAYFSYLTVEMIGKLITGDAALDNLSGPLSMAQGAGKTVQSGLVYYLSFLAVVSISLGILNLLPIPMLDGGHLLFYIYEALRGKPLGENWQEWGFRLGALTLLALFSVALYNDFSKLFY